jgi:hypothetical protein
MVRLNGNASGISYACQRPNYFPEHTNPHIQIAAPFEGASIRASGSISFLQKQLKLAKMGRLP